MRARVWAPGAGRVELGRAGGRDPMEPGGGGWWEGRPLAHGEDYHFHLDGGPARPDPRSRWQPAGVHGPSRAFDPSRHEWSDHSFRPAPWGRAVLYELHVGSFTAEGSLVAASTELPSLSALGVTHVELMPVAAFAGEHGWGYDGVCPFAIHPAYGEPADLQHFVDRAHAAGLAVLLDVVYNHLGPEGAYLPDFGPYFHPERRTPWGPVINLDGEGSAEVRRYFLDNARYWLEAFHLDGLRLDATEELYDDSDPHFLAELSREVEALGAKRGRELILVAESLANDPTTTAPRELGGHGLRAEWGDDPHHALHAWLTGERAHHYAGLGSAADVARALDRGYRRSRPGPLHPADDGVVQDGSSLVVYLQNHDQVGNRPLGDRIDGAAGISGAGAGLALVLLSRFVPMLFMGEEWGATSPFPFFCDLRAEGLGRGVREGRRRELADAGWPVHGMLDPTNRATFLAARLERGERKHPAHASRLAWVQGLLRLRREHPALGTGGPASAGFHADPQDRWVRMERGPWQVVVNASPSGLELPLEGVPLRLELASAPSASWSGRILRLPGRSAAVLGPAGGS